MTKKYNEIAAKKNQKNEINFRSAPSLGGVMFLQEIGLIFLVLLAAAFFAKRLWHGLRAQKKCQHGCGRCDGA
ncbi:MAG: hypothetical protein U0X71_08420 [Sphingobacteriaceae bacterium]|nr:MAG: hypothetical protein E6Q66_09090 [Pedobacter sp.]